MESFKELYDVFIKTTYPIDSGSLHLEEGEVVAAFDKIQVAGLNELVDRKEATGGFDNRAHVFWETTKEIDLSFSQGVFSKLQFALASNSKILSKPTGEAILISKSERKESNENSKFELDELPVGRIFVYNALTGEKIGNYSREEREVTVAEPYMDVIVNYMYNYKNGAKVVQIGRQLISGYLSLEGKTRVKDDTSGRITTGIIRIPRLKLMSDLSIRLGNQANPIVVNFYAKGIPTGTRGNSYVTEFLFLNNDVDSDL